MEFNFLLEYMEEIMNVVDDVLSKKAELGATRVQTSKVYVESYIEHIR